MSEAATRSSPAYATAPAFATLTAALRDRGRSDAGRVHIHLRADDGGVEVIRFGGLYENALTVAGALRELGLTPGQPVAIMLPTCREFFFTFMGTLLAGGIPAPIYPPLRAADLEAYARRQSGILRNAEARILVTFREAERLAKLLHIPSLQAVVRASFLLADRSTRRAPEFEAAPGDIGLIQYTSGSTGDPKGVTLTHRNLVANVRAIGQGVGARPEDVVISWLPLYHDMGLIGCWLFALYYGLELAAMSPVSFLRRPERWLWAVHQHRGTLSPAPNFAYELCARKVQGQDIQGLDLSSWRVALNGAEPIHAETLERFITRFQPYGFRPQTMMPVYGLAETTVALSFAPQNTAPRIDTIDRQIFELHGRARPSPGDAGGVLRFVSVGRALPEHEVRIVDGAGNPCPERVEGQIQFRGPSAMQGYYRRPDATAEACDGAWRRTGDLGYLAGGDLFVTGRHKDLIIQAGRNVHPQELEKLAAEVDGIRRGCVAAFSLPDAQSGTERVVMVAETRATDPARQRRLAAEVKRRVGAGSISPDTVVIVPPHAVPKTPSGKIQRDACKRLYLAGKLTATAPPVWWQVVKLAGGAVARRVREKFGSRTG